MGDSLSYLDNLLPQVTHKCLKSCSNFLKTLLTSCLKIQELLRSCFFLYFGVRGKLSTKMKIFMKNFTLHRCQIHIAY